MNRFVIVLLACAAAACSPPAAPPDSPPAATTLTPAPQARTAAEIATVIAVLPAPYNAGVYDNGKRLFGQCRSCHTIDAGGANRIGPHLHGVFGRTAGSVADFKSYSPALKASGIVWDEARIDAWVANPRDLVATTSMIFPGIRNPEDRRDLIAYLKVEASD